MERIAVGGTPGRPCHPLSQRARDGDGSPAHDPIRRPNRQLTPGSGPAAAVHLVTGRTFGGVCNNRMIARHPDTGELIGGLEIPGGELLVVLMKLST